MYLRSGGTRNAGSRYLSSGLQANALQTNALPPFKGSESMAYLRVGLSDPSRSGLWAQLIASTIRAGESRATTSQSGTSAVPAVTDSVDTTRVRSQYVATVGANVGSLRLSATGRFRSIEQKLDIAPSVRAEYDAGWFGVGVHGEKGVDSTLRTDVQFRLTPTDWFHVGGAASRQDATSAAERALTTVRAEAALQWRGRWLGGGWLSRSQSLVSPPVELDSDLRSVRTPAATAITLSLRAPLFSGWSADVDAINWDAPAAYRPQTQTRSSLRFESSFLGSFPRGNFHLLVAGFHEYRSTTFVPKGADPTGQSTPAAGSFSSQLEIRIGTATISWQARNLFGTVFETYPGYVMPRITNIYGVRWEFWN